MDIHWCWVIYLMLRKVERDAIIASEPTNILHPNLAFI